MSGMWMLKFFILQAVFVGVVIVVLRNVFFNSTEGAIQRLSRETEDARGKQAELDQKIKEANEELEKRRKEAGEMAKKMLLDAEEKAKEERDKIIKKARDDSEEIISKAQRTKDQMRKDIESEVNLKMITYAADLLDDVLSEKAKGALDQQLYCEFIENLEKVDTRQMGTGSESAEIVTAHPIDQNTKNKIVEAIKKKIGANTKVEATTDPQIIGGIIVKFGSLALDASLQNYITESSIKRKEKAEGP